MSKNKLCRFYIVRHGQTEWNRQHRIQGQKDSPLTDEGINQAEQLAKKLKEIEFADIYSSDLLRAQRTAEIVALERKSVVKTSQLLREISFGQIEGKKYQQFRQELRQVLEAREKMEKQVRFKTPIDKGVESDEQVVKRFLLFLRQTALAYLGENVLIVSHGGVIRSLLIYFDYGDYQSLPHGCVSNAGYLVIESDGIDFFLKEVNGVNKL